MSVIRSCQEVIRQLSRNHIEIVMLTSGSCLVVVKQLSSRHRIIMNLQDVSFIPQPMGLKAFSVEYHDFIWRFDQKFVVRFILIINKKLNATSEMIQLHSAKLVLRRGKRTEVLKKPLKMKEERKFFSFLKPDTGWVRWPKLKLRDWSHTLSWKSRNPTIYNIIRWDDGSTERSSRRLMVQCLFW